MAEFRNSTNTSTELNYGIEWERKKYGPAVPNTSADTSGRPAAGREAGRRAAVEAPSRAGVRARRERGSRSRRPAGSRSRGSRPRGVGRRHNLVGDGARRWRSAAGGGAGLAGLGDGKSSGLWRRVRGLRYEWETRSWARDDCWAVLGSKF